MAAISAQSIDRSMRRAMFPGRGAIRVEDAPVPHPGSGELLVRVEACAICGSDRQVLEPGSAATPGHEAAGTVVMRGDGATIAEGTRGAVFLVAYCDRCSRCRSNSRGACLSTDAMLGFTRDGGFAEYEVVPERCFLPVHPSLSAEDAVMLLDMTGTPMHALRRVGLFERPAAIAAVVGAGPVGLASVMALRAVGVARVVALDLIPFRLEFARRLGAEPFAADTDAVTHLRAEFSEAFPVVIEASGNPGGQRLALDLVGPGGTLVVVGHSPAPLQVHSGRDLIQEEKTIMGSEYFDPGEFERNQQMVLDGRHSPSQLITHRVALDEIAEGYRLFWGGQTGKVLVCPNGLGGTP